MSDPVFISALSHLADHSGPDGLSISMGEITDRGMIDLRGPANDTKFFAAAKKALGVDLPKAPRSSASKAKITVLWLSVDQWLVLCPRGETAKLLAKLNGALKGIHSLAVDVSDARTILRLEGDGVREVLMKGTPVDLTLPEYGAGLVRRVQFGEIAALIHIVSEGPDVIELYVFRSYAVFAWDWLKATAKQPAALRVFGSQDAPAV